MKHGMPPRSPILRANSVDTSPANPSLMKQGRSSKRKHKSYKENAPPSDANVVLGSSPSPSLACNKPAPAAAGKLRSMLPPRPPPSNPLKRKLANDVPPESGVSGSSDTGVKVIVRMRPPNKIDEGDMIVKKTSNDTLSILGQQFTFDSVEDAASTQVDIFQLVGAPLVENCLAGFNSSVFAYGQTGSGKTYTIWGPVNALLEDKLSSDQQGLTPRVFEQLFSRITEEQNKHADKQLIYQCRCSFLEIYNEQFTDLLNPAQRNLHIREDTKTGVYVENLTEETVCNIEDMTQLLKKGLSNRRIGATSINLESSRSHGVFTCSVESRCKSTEGLSCFKTSRINLVDLAGSERQKLTGATGDRLKEAGNINRSLSQLGNLINILAEVSQTGKQRHIPYRDSKLTFLLQESLGGNAKLAMVCAVSPAQSCRSETFSTLRFAQRAKAIKNKAVVNEKMQDDVNTLREVIQQLKDELLRMKENGNQANPIAGYSNGWNARRSLTLLKFSLNRPLILPRVDDDGDEEMEIVEEAEKVLLANSEVSNKMDSCSSGTIKEKVSEAIDGKMGEEITGQVGKLEVTVAPCEVVEVPSEVSPDLKSPTPSVSPIIDSSSRKSLRTSSMLSASQRNLTKTTLSEAVDSSCVKPSDNISLNLLSAQISKSCFAPSDRLAASLHRGLEVIDKHRKSFALGCSSFRFSYKPVDSKPVVVRKDVAVQTPFQDNELAEEKPIVFLCSNCKFMNSRQVKDGTDGSNLELVPVEGSPLADTSKVVPKAVEKVLAGAIRREMALEEICTRQNSEIAQLNRLVQQYKHERECNSVIGQIREDKIARLGNLMDDVLSAEEFVDDELTSLTNENKILKEKYENHPEVTRTEIELKRVQDELERYQNFFDLGERDVLLEEIQDLKTQLQTYTDSSDPKSFRRQNPDRSVGPLLCTIPESTVKSAEKRFELERFCWDEAESKWISVVEELKSELKSTRLLAEKQKHELEMEKKCSEELKEAMQIAMEGHARMLEQYADLEEKHMHFLTQQRRIEDGIEGVKQAAARAGVNGAESRFINALAAEISTLKAEREKERCHYKDENKGLRAQLRDTAEAVQAAGELLVRLKDAEEAVAAAQARAREAEQETEKAYKQIEKLKKKHEIETAPPVYDVPVYDEGEPKSESYQQLGDEFYDANERELTKLPEPSSWFSGYDRCNI